MSNNREPLLLSGIRVLDLSQGIAGPYCCGILGRQGADVVKVEPPSGDWSRGMGAQKGGLSAVLFACNVGKRGLCIDASGEAGRAALMRIAGQVDVVVQNFRPGVVERLGLDYAALARRNTKLIYVSISGFGSTGPYVALPATDTVMQAMTGMMSINRDNNGLPRRVGIYLADLSAALYASQLVSAALFRRTQDGRGRHLQLSLLEACAALQSINIADVTFAGARDPAAGPPSAPSGVFQTRDGYLALSTLNDAMFRRLAAALRHDEWVSDTRFADTASRLRHAGVLNPQVADILRSKTTQHWCRSLTASDVLHAAVQDYRDLLDDPQVDHSGIIQWIEQSGVGTLPLARQPGCESAAVPGAPRLGEHTHAVLSDFGFSTVEIEDLLATKAALSI